MERFPCPCVTFVGPALCWRPSGKSLAPARPPPNHNCRQIRGGRRGGERRVWPADRERPGVPGQSGRGPVRGQQHVPPERRPLLVCRSAPREGPRRGKGGDTEPAPALRSGAGRARGDRPDSAPGSIGASDLFCCFCFLRHPPPPNTHPSARKSVLESANPRMDSEGASGCAWSTARATAPSPGRPTPGVVKQDKSSGGSVDTTQTRSGPQRVRMSSGERPIGAAKGKQSDTEALCHPPPPRVQRMPCPTNTSVQTVTQLSYFLFVCLFT